MIRMGTSQSTPSTPKFLDEPWRVTMGWGESVRNTLKSQVEDIRPAAKLSVPYNILLVGEMASGKSSFINSIHSVLQGRVCTDKARAGAMSTLVTKEFKMHTFRPDLPFRICDTMGVQPSYTYVHNMLQAVDGHVPDGFEFPLNVEFNVDNPGYVANPTLADKAHCVAIVISAVRYGTMQQDSIEKLRDLVKSCFQRKIPVFVLLTTLDEAIQEFHKDITKTFHSITLNTIVHYVSSMFLGITKNHILPIVNYTKEVELDDNIDVLLLYALRQMLYASQTHLENNSEHDHVPVSLGSPEPTCQMSQEEEEQKETKKNKEQKAPVEMEFSSIAM